MADRNQLIALTSRTSLFEGLDDAAYDAIVKEMREVRFDSGQVIFSRGDEGKEAYLVAEGRVRLSVLTAEGRELSFAHAEAGSLFGEIAMLDAGLRTADATAATKVVAYSLSRAGFQRVMEAFPAVAKAMMHFLCRRLREADQQLEAIALCPIEQRLARFFLAAVRASAGDEPEEEVIEIPFTMSQSELALLIGASRPKVNTALSILEGNGAIKRSGRKIRCSLYELEDIAGL